MFTALHRAKLCKFHFKNSDSIYSKRKTSQKGKSDHLLNPTEGVVFKMKCISCMRVYLEFRMI